MESSLRNEISRREMVETSFHHKIMASEATRMGGGGANAGQTSLTDTDLTEQLQKKDAKLREFAGTTPLPCSNFIRERTRCTTVRQQMASMCI